MATHSSILPWRILWTKELVQSVGLPFQLRGGSLKRWKGSLRSFLERKNSRGKTSLEKSSWKEIPPLVPWEPLWGSLVLGSDAPLGNKIRIKPGIMWQVAENPEWRQSAWI